MQTVADRPEAPTAIRTDLGAIFVSLELSRSTWLVTSLSPGGGEKMSKQVVRGGDVAGLLEHFARLREKALMRTGKVFPFVVIQEAGLDGFWIDRALQNEGIESHVVDPASIATSRSAPAWPMTQPSSALGTNVQFSFGFLAPLLQARGTPIVRITCQLIETASGTHVWAERYDRPLGDIFALQDEITLSVVGAIEPSLRQAEIERAKRKRPENLDAYDLYLRALPYAQVAMPGDCDKALEWLHRSLALEPDYAAAHAIAAWCYEQRYLRAGMHEADKIAGLSHARAALGAGADDPTTLATAGFVIGLVEHDYQTAMNAIDNALALNGSSTLALALGATILAHDGQATRAIEYGELALRLSPHEPTAYLQLTALGIAHLAAGRFEEAAAVCNKACQSNPRFSFPVVLQTAALSRLGRADEAKATARRVLELEPRFSVAGFVQAHTGRAEIWNPIGNALRHVGLPE